MLFSISIVEGRQSGKQFWLEKSVARLGSHPNCEICIPSADLPESLATLELRDSDCLIHNRADTALSFSVGSVSPGEAMIWPIGERLQLPDGSILELHLSEDRPRDKGSDAVERWDDDDSEEVIQTSTLTEQSGSLETIGQLAVIVGCLLAMAIMIYTQFIQEDTLAKPTSDADISAILETLNNSETSGAATIRRMLVNAELAISRGNHNEARDIFRELHRLLSQDASSSANEEKTKDLLIFLESRLQ